MLEDAASSFDVPSAPPRFGSLNTIISNMIQINPNGGVILKAHFQFFNREATFDPTIYPIPLPTGTAK